MSLDTTASALPTPTVGTAMVMGRIGCCMRDNPAFYLLPLIKIFTTLPHMGINLCFLLLLMFPFHCRLDHLSPLPHPSLSFSTPPNPAKSVFTQSSHLRRCLPLLLPFTLSMSALFVNRSPSIWSICATHFNQLFTSFLLKATHGR